MLIMRSCITAILIFALELLTNLILERYNVSLRFKREVI